MAERTTLIGKSQRRTLYIVLGLNIIEGLFTIFTEISIQADPKNAFLLGLSIKRLGILAVSVLLLLFQIALLIQSHTTNQKMDRILQSQKQIRWIKWSGFIAALCLWITIWLPIQSLGAASDAWIRIKPLILWVAIMIFQFYLYTKRCLNEMDTQDARLSLKKSAGWIYLAFGLIIVTFSMFFVLRSASHGSLDGQLVFPPSAPLAPLQLFAGCLLLLSLFFITNTKKVDATRKGLTGIFFLLIWGFTFILWYTAPFPCTNDRAGPYPPNNQCYSSINDAVYTIGSHYITLGEGVYNHWQTDKPLYLIFLAIGQWIFGPDMDQYLTFQIIILALIPALLYLLGKEYSNTPQGIFLSFLAMLIGLNEIIEYKSAGGANAKVENTELLTALFLILLCFAVFHWLRNENKIVWASVSGGILGLASLIRLNPLFIVPFLLVLVILTGWERRKKLFTEVILFLITFMLAFLPGILSIRDTNGNNYYLAKIQNVIDERYSSPEPPSAPQTPVEQNPLHPGLQKMIPGENEKPQSNIKSILLHFMNNEFSSIAILPVNFTLLNARDQMDQPLWNNPRSGPIWELEFSFENSFVFLLHTAIVISGLVFCIKRFGTAGSVGLLIQISYHLGNAFAMTSGSRYLQPVNWVTLFYYAAGLSGIFWFILKIFSPVFRQHRSEVQPDSEKPEKSNPFGKKPAFQTLASLVFFLVCGLLIPVMNHLPSLLPEETSKETDQLAKEWLLSSKSISAEQWEAFIQNPDHLIVTGKAYSPRYYRSSNFDQGNPSFELMMLGRDHVFASYMYKVEPDKTFSDESSVILVGCKIGQDTRWSSDRIIMQSYAVIQLDHEESTYFDKTTSWACKH